MTFSSLFSFKSVSVKVQAILNNPQGITRNEEAAMQLCVAQLKAINSVKKINLQYK